jgi:hypothetical protein
MSFTPTKSSTGAGQSYLANNFEFAISTATIGNHNLTSTDKGTFYVELPVGQTATFLRSTCRINEGNFPATTTVVKIQKYTAPSTFIDVATFTIPANSTVGGNIAGVITNAALVNGDQLTVNLSQSAAGAGFTLPFLIQTV